MLHNLLGDLMREQGHVAEARESAEAALALSGLPWKISTDAVVLMADVEREMRLFPQTKARLSSLREEARSRQYPAIRAIALRGLGEVYLAAGDLASAMPTLRKALAIFENGQNPHQVAIPLQMRADTASRQGASLRAGTDLDRARPILESRLGPRSAIMGAHLGKRGIIEECAGDNNAPATHFETATGILRQAGPETLGVTTVLMAQRSGKGHSGGSEEFSAALSYCSLPRASTRQASST